MTHVDYLCPICDARIGTARVGAYADPLDPVTCDRCHRKFRFHDLLPRWNAGLLKPSGFVPPGPPAPPPVFVAERGIFDFTVGGSSTLVTIPGIVMGAGSTVVVSVTHDATLPPTSVTWNSIPLTQVVDGGGAFPFANLTVWKHDNCPAATASVVVDMVAANPTQEFAVVLEFSGTSAQSFDQSSIATGGGATSNSGFTAVTTQANELLLAVGGFRNGPSPVWIEPTPNSGAVALTSGDLVHSYTTAQVTAIGSYRARSTASGGAWTVAIVTFKS